MTYANNPDYQQIFHSEVHDKRFYAPSATNEYHLSRYTAAGAQNIYSGSGGTKEVFKTIFTHILSICNKEKKTDTLITDIGTLCNNALYRMQYPVDEDCAIRMGAIYALMEGEAPDSVNAQTTEQKVKMTKDDPDLYAFFLDMGKEFTANWTQSEKDMADLDYFRKRAETLGSLTPIEKR